MSILPFSKYRQSLVNFKYGYMLLNFMTIAMIGSHDVGKTAVLGLLYQTMMATTNQSNNKFLFTQTSEMADKVVEIIPNMLNGEFPGGTETGNANRWRFLLGFSADSFVIEQLQNMRYTLYQWGEYGIHATQIAYMLDIPGEIINELVETAYETIDDDLKEVFKSDILVLLIDASRLTEASTGDKCSILTDYDSLMMQLITFYNQCKVEEYIKTGERQELYPFIYFTKMDLLEDSVFKYYEEKKNMDIEHIFGEINEDHFGLIDEENVFPGSNYYENNKEDINELGGLFMRRYMGQTSTQISGSHLVGVNLHTPQYFFSWVNGLRTAIPDSRDVKIKQRRTDAGLVNVFSYHMYQAFLHRIKELSPKTLDPPERVAQLYKERKDVDINKLVG